MQLLKAGYSANQANLAPVAVEIPDQHQQPRNPHLGGHVALPHLACWQRFSIYSVVGYRAYQKGYQKYILVTVVLIIIAIYTINAG